MSCDHHLVSATTGLTTITMNRPERRNARSEAHMRELLAALGAAAAEPSTRAVVLTGAGPVFSSGHDFADMAERDLDGMRRLLATCTELMLAIQRAPFPVVASVQGIATAAGCQLVASCDLAVAAEHARFATPGGKGGWFCTTPMVAVARAVGRKRALEMLFTGDMIDAPTALEWGLVNAVVPTHELETAVHALATRIAQSSPAVLALGKRAFYAQDQLPEAAAYAVTEPVMVDNAQTGDAREGMQAFLDKRAPEWPK